MLALDGLIISNDTGEPAHVKVSRWSEPCEKRETEPILSFWLAPQGLLNWWAPLGGWIGYSSREDLCVEPPGLQVWPAWQER